MGGSPKEVNKKKKTRNVRKKNLKKVSTSK
jgi:hypothetical protein